MASLSARDIAKHIQRPDEPLIAAVDRLRNWTKMGIIKPAGRRHPGTGRKKQYSVVALAQAIILQALVDGIGGAATALQSLIAALRPQDFDFVLYVIREGFKGPELLVFRRRPKRGGPFFYFMPADYLPGFLADHPDWDVYVIVDVQKILGRVPFDWAAALIEEFPDMEPKTKKTKKSLEGNSKSEN